MTIKNIVLICKRTTLELYKRSFSARIEEMKTSKNPLLGKLILANKNHYRSVNTVKKNLDKRKIKYSYYNSFNKKIIDCPSTFLIAIGGDGTILQLSQKIKKARILGVNSDPDHSIGFLCAATANNFVNIFDEVQHNTLKPTAIDRLKLVIDGKVKQNFALNEILISHASPAATSRYNIKYNHISEDHKCSGLWVSTPAGSTAAMASCGGEIQDLQSNKMQFFVREPYYIDSKQAPKLKHFFVPFTDKIEITSQMAAGRIYIDGSLKPYNFYVSSKLEISKSTYPLQLYMTEAMKKRRQQIANIKEKL